MYWVTHTWVLDRAPNILPTIVRDSWDLDEAELEE